MGLDYSCDFCPDGTVNILKGSGKQVLVKPSSYINKQEARISPRIKFRCERCQTFGVTTTEDDLTVCTSMNVVKFSEIKSTEIKHGINTGSSI